MDGWMGCIAVNGSLRFGVCAVLASEWDRHSVGVPKKDEDVDRR
jgi:hypothetical protein